jgi:hypothetical protein
MRVLVCGGRDFADGELLSETLNRIGVTVLIHGAARGADSMAASWAAARQISAESYPADWHRHGKAAGPIRNKQMLDEGKPDLVVAFAGGRGTANMIRQARAARIRVIEV